MINTKIRSLNYPAGSIVHPSLVQSSSIEPEHYELFYLYNLHNPCNLWFQMFIPFFMQSSKNFTALITAFLPIFLLPSFCVIGIFLVKFPL